MPLWMAQQGKDNLTIHPDNGDLQLTTLVANHHILFLDKKINIMDSTATTLCMDNEIPILVMDINKKGNLKKLIEGKKIGTVVDNK